MSFRYCKWYADVVTPAGDVLVAYLTWLDAWGMRQRAAGVELYGIDGSRVTLAARGCPAEPSLAAVAEGWELDLPLTAGILRLRLCGAAVSWQPAGPAAHPALDWRVVTLRSQATASWQVGARRGTLRGLGYVDRVVLRSPPRRLGLVELAWGRAHPGEAAVVFTAAVDRRGRAWRRAAIWAGGAPQPATDLRLMPRVDGLDVFLDGPGPLFPSRVRLGPGRALHRGPALDRTRFPDPVRRAVARALAGPIHEERHVARLGTEYRAVYERVVFGRRE